jgi:DHA1 family bicyclomycin/chloramphenicol resistance-like MFS transporter
MNPPAPSRFPGWLVLLGALMAVAPLSIDMYLPGFPAVAREFKVAPGAVQLTLAAFFVGISLGQLFYGPISDRFGRRKPLYIGFALYGLASIACALAPTVTALAGWRFVQAVGGCAGIVITRAVVRDRCEPVAAAKAFSVLMLVMGIAPILAPLFGGLIITWFSWRVIFAVLAVFAALCLAGIHFGLKESLDRRHVHPLELGRTLRSYGSLLLDRHFMSHTLASGLAMTGMFAYIAGSPFVIIELYGVPATHYGWVFGANAFGLIAASQINGRLLHRHTLSQLLKNALWLPPLAGMALLGAAALGHPPLPVVLAGLFAYVTSIGFIAPNGGALALQHQGHRAGVASALMGSLQFLLATLAGLIMGVWHSQSLWPLATMMALCGSSAFLLHRRLALPTEQTA